MWETWVLSMYRPGYNINLIDGETSGSEPANSASSPPPHAHSIPHNLLAIIPIYDISS